MCNKQKYMETEMCVIFAFAEGLIWLECWLTAEFDAVDLHTAQHYTAGFYCIVIIHH